MDEPELNPEQPRRRRLRLVLATTAVVTLIILIAVRPSIPHRIVLLTDSKDSAWYALGQRYARDLEPRGLQVDVVATEGAMDNVQRLTGHRNAVAFAPATLDQWINAADDDSRIEALGSIGFEPVWLFVRTELNINRLPDLQDHRLVTDGEGTTAEHVARELLRVNNLTDHVEVAPTAGLTAATITEGFSSGTIDAALVTGDATSPLVEAALASDGTEILPFERAAAYHALIPGVARIVVPEGVLDLARNVPADDLQVLATTTCLIAHEDLHPAVVPLLLKTAENVREQRTSFSTDVTFPGDHNLTLPLAPAARRWFNQGETGLLSHLPYQATRILNHLGLFVLPLLAVIGAAVKLVPAALRAWFGFRLQGWLKELAAVEKQHVADNDLSQLIERLDRIDAASAKMFVPRPSSHDYIDFRQFLHDLRDRVKSRQNEATE